MRDKSGKLTSATLAAGMIIIILITVLITVIAEIVPDAQAEGELMSRNGTCIRDGGFFNDSTTGVCQANATNSTVVGSSEIPLGDLVGAGGVVFVLVMAFFLLVIIKGALGGKK